MTTIWIHEFSTGIQVQETADGGWVSGGFTGDYMNQTLDDIPEPVRNAIANREFAVGERASRDDPTLIGREVMASEEEAWSVVAVVTRGQDNRGREPSLYRYFLCEGKDNLAHIVSWMMRVLKHVPVFNPLDLKERGQESEYDTEQTVSINLHNPELENLLEEDATPIAIPFDQNCSPLILNLMATQRSQKNGQPVSWAYKIEVLEKPSYFQVVLPASEKAQVWLAGVRGQGSRSALAEEHPLRNAIKMLSRRGKNIGENLEIIDRALSNPQVSDDPRYLRDIFDGQGARDARTQGIYDAPSVRLLTLQAVLIPETLPQLLLWLKKREPKPDASEVFRMFQSELAEHFGVYRQKNLAIEERLIQGIKVVSAAVVEQPELAPEVVNLLDDSRGLWKKYYDNRIRGEIDEDLNKMKKFARGDRSITFEMARNEKWNEILTDLQEYWQTQTYPQERYLSLAELLADLRHYRPAALFYYVADGEVPKDIFEKLGYGGFATDIYGLRVRRTVDSLERFVLDLKRIGGLIVPLYLVTIIVTTISIACLGLGYAAGNVLPIARLIPEPEQAASNQDGSGTGNNSSGDPGSSASNSGNDASGQNQGNSDSDGGSVNNQSSSTQTDSPVFEDNQKSLSTMVNEFELYLGKDRTTTEAAIASILSEVHEGETIAFPILSREAGKEAFKSYQKKVMPAQVRTWGGADGIMTTNGATYNVLKCHVARRLAVEVKNVPEAQCQLSEIYDESLQPNNSAGNAPAEG